MNNEFLDAINNQFTKAYAIVDELEKLNSSSQRSAISDALSKVSQLQRYASYSQSFY